MKRILLISTRYFDYPEKIKREFISNGMKCDLVYETPIFYKFLKQLGLKKVCDYFYFVYVNLFYFLVKNKDYYNEVVIIRCENISNKLLSKISSFNGRKTLYEWDSYNNLSRFEEISSFCDRVLTFDLNDAKNFDIQYKSLFFCKEYYSSKGQDKLYDVCFVGSWHKDRNLIVNSFKKECEQKKLVFHAHLYMSFLLYLKLFILRKDRPKFNEVTFRSLSDKDILTLYHSSKYILDIHSATQSGFTMRTFEALAAGCCLITTNNSVLKSNFFDSCFLLSRESCHLDMTELNQLNPVNEAFLKEYSLKNWVLTLFD